MTRDNLIKSATNAIDKAPTSAEAARRIIDMVLEEAAKVARDCDIYDGDSLINSDIRASCAAAIRALKGAR
jgi:hypothetical protein